jgi:hypothetical protein
MAMFDKRSLRMWDQIGVYNIGSNVSGSLGWCSLPGDPQLRIGFLGYLLGEGISP